MYKKIRWIISFIVLAALSLALPVSCDQMPTPDGGGNSDTPGGDSNTDTDGDGVMNSADVDDDNDGLIEIHNLDMFNNIRFNLAGTSYDDEDADSGSGDAGVDTGCPAAGCNGYELMANLDFAQGSSYISGSANWTNQTWRPVNAVTPSSSSMLVAPDSAVNAGFPGIGAASGDTGGFNAIFEGNGKTIANLYSRNTSCVPSFDAECNIGLFSLTNSAAHIRNLVITSGNVYAGANGFNYVGGLVGRNEGTITTSAATVDANGGVLIENRVGCLVGLNIGSITASYASGNANGGDGDDNRVGGLVGLNGIGGSIIASFARGNANGGTGDMGPNNIGGLVGYNSGTIRASFATGSANGGTVSFEYVGGLVGYNSGTIIASYATSNAGGADNVGRLVGANADTITESYGFGTATRAGTGTAGTAFPTIGVTPITSATQLGASETATTGDAGDSWNNATNNTEGAWNFGTTSQNPALVYNDYDGSDGTTYPSCTEANRYPLTIPGTTTTLTCGTTLVGGNSAQGR